MYVSLVMFVCVPASAPSAVRLAARRASAPLVTEELPVSVTLFSRVRFVSMCAVTTAAMTPSLSARIVSEASVAS